MPTLMTKPTFDMLTAVWLDLAAHTDSERIGPSNIFVPWAGEKLLTRSRGLYYVGIAINAEIADGAQSFEAGLQSTEAFCRELSLGHTPFWSFLNELTLKILGRSYNKSQDLWGWSNLLKIAGTAGSPRAWPLGLIERQLPACITALKEEIAQLRDSLIVVASSDDYGILPQVVAEESH